MKQQYEKILELQKQYTGHQDVYSEERTNFFISPVSESQCEFIETRSHIFDSNPKSAKVGLEISTSSDYENNYAYHNLRIITNLNHVDKIEFCAGGSVIDQSYPSLLKNYTPFAIFQEHVLPALQTHSYQIYAQCNAPTQIMYDIVKLRNSPIDRLPKDRSFEKIYKFIDYSGPEPINGQNSNHQIKIYNRNPVLYLKALLPVSATNVFLIINDDANNKLEFSKEFEEDKYVHWKLNLGRRGINFARLEKAIVTFDTDCCPDCLSSQSVHIFSYGFNILRILSEMCGKAYS